jgi:hypothetical protein
VHVLVPVPVPAPVPVGDATADGSRMAVRPAAHRSAESGTDIEGPFPAVDTDECANAPKIATRAGSRRFGIKWGLFNSNY